MILTRTSCSDTCQAFPISDVYKASDITIKARRHKAKVNHRSQGQGLDVQGQVSGLIPYNQYKNKHQSFMYVAVSLLKYFFQSVSYLNRSYAASITITI
jgi:hypothetical protein